MITIKDEDGLTPLIKLVATTNPKLLVNVSLALGRCAQDKETLIKIHQLDGVRLIWSMLKNPSEEVLMDYLIDSFNHLFNHNYINYRFNLAPRGPSAPASRTRPTLATW